MHIAYVCQKYWQYLAQMYRNIKCNTAAIDWNICKKLLGCAKFDCTIQWVVLFCEACHWKRLANFSLHSFWWLKIGPLLGIDPVLPVMNPPTLVETVSWHHDLAKLTQNELPIDLQTYYVVTLLIGCNCQQLGKAATDTLGLLWHCISWWWWWRW